MLFSYLSTARQEAWPFKTLRPSVDLRWNAPYEYLSRATLTYVTVKPVFPARVSEGGVWWSGLFNSTN